MGRVLAVVAVVAAALVVWGAAGVASDTAGPPAARVNLGAGMSLAVPRGWHVARRLTGLAEPFERFTLASFALAPQPRSDQNSCGPTRAVDSMPPTGVLAFVFEYPVGQVRGRFPSRPRHFALPAGSAQDYECFGRGWLVRFRAGRRHLQAMIALGARSGASRARLFDALDTLVVDPRWGTG